MRRDIQNSQESLITLSKRYGINPKTVTKWRAHKGEGVADRKMGSKISRSVLSVADEAVICEFRRQTLFPLDDCYDVLKDQISKLSRLNLHRCLQRHGLSRLPRQEGEAAPKKKFKDYPIGFVYVDIAELHIGKQKLYLFVGICRVSEYAYAEIFESMTLDNTLIFLVIIRMLTRSGHIYTVLCWLIIMLKNSEPSTKKHLKKWS